MYSQNLVLYFSFLLGVLLCTNCSKLEVGPPGKDGVSDKQIRFAFGNNGTTTDTLRSLSTFDLIKFNKANYVGVDSIVFVSQMRTTVEKDSCFIDLWNITDNKAIASSRLKNGKTTFEWKESKNIWNSLPYKEITLAIVLRSQNKTTLVEGGQSYLFLYRD